MKVAFIEQKITEQGTSIAIYDYAHYNEEILGNESYTYSLVGGNPDVEDKFSKRFKHSIYRNREELEKLLKEDGIEFAYFQKSGKKAEAYTEVCPYGVHCVFTTRHPHGSVYASISQYLNDRNHTNFPVAPLMVTMPKVEGDMRDELGIPKEALVYGRHGGFVNFSLPFVKEVVAQVLAEKEDVYFLFLNTDRFLPEGSPGYDRCIHLPSTPDRKQVAKFINTCDAMLHARKSGETFGLACAEFSILNKPVITWAPPTGLAALRLHIRNYWVKITGKGDRIPHRMPRAHIDILKELAIIYHDGEELHEILTHPETWIHRFDDWDAYSAEYAPEPVMKRFKEVFLTPENWNMDESSDGDKSVSK